MYICIYTEGNSIDRLNVAKDHKLMNKDEFEQFVLQNGKDILRFCRMISGGIEGGDELYQDTMLTLSEKLKKLDNEQNVKSYAISVSVLLWKNKKKKYSVRERIAQIGSLEEYAESGEQFKAKDDPEQLVMRKSETQALRELVSGLPEKYRIPLYLYYSANMKTEDIAKHLHIPLGTVKTRLRKAKAILKEKMEALGYDE